MQRSSASSSAFTIQLSWKQAGEPVSNKRIAAEDFFDPEFFQNRNPDSIRIDAPWLHDDLRDYALAHSPAVPMEWIRLEMLDERTKERRWVEQQSWSGHWISVDRGEGPVNDATCVIILRLMESGGASFQTLKLQLSPMSFAIRGHSLYKGNNPDSPDSISYFEGYAKQS